MMDVFVDAIEKRSERSRDEQIRQLAAESVENADQLRPHLGWLVTADAKCGAAFGYELSVRDAGGSLLDDILAAQRASGDNGSGYFLGGYLRGIFEGDAVRWDEIMQGAAGDEKLCRFFVELASRSGMTDTIGMLILDMARDGRISVDDFDSIASLLPSTPSPDVMRGWLWLLMEDGSDKSVMRALGMFYALFTRRGARNDDTRLTLRLLTHGALLGGDGRPPADPIVAHRWEEVAMDLAGRRDKAALLALCGAIFENMSSVLARDWILKVLDRIASEYPDDVWDAAVQYLGIPPDGRGHAILQWMRGDSDPSKPAGFLEMVDPGRVFDWIDADPASPPRRAACMARYAPPLLEPGSVSMELARRYGDDPGVARGLSGTFMADSHFSGSMAEHYRRDRERILEYRKHATDPALGAWLDYHLKALSERIEQALAWEERLPA